MKDSLKKLDFIKGEMVILDLTFLFYLMRSSIPFFKYPFLVLYGCLIIYSLIKKLDQIGPSLIKFARNYYLIILLILILIVSFFLSDKLFLTIFKDVLNAVILISIFFLTSLYIKTNKQLNNLVSHLIVLIILFAIVISFNELLNLLDLFTGSNVSPLIGIPPDTGVTIFEIDNNFSTLPLIFSMIAIIFFLIKTDSTRRLIICNLLLIIFSFSLFLSGSKRGLILLCIIIFLLVLIQILRFLSKKNILLRLGSRTIYFLLSVIVLASSLLYMTFNTSNAFKNRTLEILGSKNVLDTKVKITDIIIRYTTVFNRTVTFNDLYKIIWTPEFNSTDPESSWGTRNHKSVFPLTGKNVEIVPAGCKGYLLDNTTNSHKEGTYCDAYSLLAKLEVNKGDRYKASVYCFVSEDFDGDMVRLAVGTDYIYKKIVFGDPAAFYNLHEKGVWRKLEINFECNTGQVPIYISIVKNGVKNLSNLKGFTIFAYPIYKKIEKSDSVLSHANLKNIIIGNMHQPDINKIQSSESNFLYHEDVYFSKMNLPIHLNSCTVNPVIFNRWNSASLFNISTTLAHVPYAFFNNQDQDPVRNWANKFISEDTIFYAYKSDLAVDAAWNKYGDERIVRWLFGIQIFSKEFNWQQRIFGGGFNFLNWYGYYFMKDKTSSDWPHNPFLSILLYSGILGFLIYCYFIYKVFYYYLKYIKEYPILFIFFLITFYFTFFSGGSPLDPPIMGFFVILPFFIHSVHMKDNHELNN